MRINNPYKSLIIIGGGNSIKDFDFTLLKDYFTFGLNHICRYLETTALLWLDTGFYHMNRQYIDAKNVVKITRYLNNGQLPQDIIKLKTEKQYFGTRGLNKGLWKGKLGGLAGLFSLSLAIALKFKTIYLLGFDMNITDGKTHFHSLNEHNRKHHLESYEADLKSFDVYKNSLNLALIYNVSPNSAIKVFPKLTYAGFLYKLKEIEKINQKKAKEWLKGAIDEKE